MIACASTIPTKTKQKEQNGLQHPGLAGLREHKGSLLLFKEQATITK